MGCRIGKQERIALVLGAGSVLGDLAMVSCVNVGPGLIRCTSDMSGLRFGEIDGSMSRRALAFQDACQNAGFSAEWVSNIRAAQCAKFVGLATNAALASLFRPNLADAMRQQTDVFAVPNPRAGAGVSCTTHSPPTRWRTRPKRRRSRV